MSAMILMVGAMVVLKKNRNSGEIPLNTLERDPDQNVSVNTLEGDQPPPYPGGDNPTLPPDNPTAGGSTGASFEIAL